MEHFPTPVNQRGNPHQQQKQQQIITKMGRDELEDDPSRPSEDLQVADPDGAAVEPETSVSLPSMSRTVLAPYKVSV